MHLGQLSDLRVKYIGKWNLMQTTNPETSALHVQEYFARSWQTLSDSNKVLFFGIALAKRIPVIRFPYRSVLMLVPPYSDRDGRVRLVEALRKLGRETKAPVIAWGGDSVSRLGVADGLTIYVQTGEDVRGYFAPTQRGKNTRSVGAWSPKSSEPPPTETLQ